MATEELATSGYAEQGSREYRHISMAMFFAGMSTFAQLYCAQPLLPILVKYFSITPAQASLAVSAATMLLACGLLLGTFFANQLQRKSLMVGALVISSVFTLLAGLTPNFHILVILSACRGFTLAGVPAIAMAYIGEEIHSDSHGRSMGLYIAGTIVGGVSGRVGVTLLADVLSWRWSVAIVGLVCLLLAFLFAYYLPQSKHFVPYQLNIKRMWKEVFHYLSDPVLLALYSFAGLAMGSYVSIYNYIGFHLLGAPYLLPQKWVGMIYMIYVAGVLGSNFAGVRVDRLGHRSLLWKFTALMLLGTLGFFATPLWLVLVGLVLFTFAFFAAHTTASSWVGKRSKAGRAVASSLYLLFYYIGSSVLGTYNGVLLHAHGWVGVAWMTLAVCAVSSLLAIIIKFSKTKSVGRKAPEGLPMN
jgi:MFS transporter, YNFM family, putative membrane transport protein